MRIVPTLTKSPLALWCKATTTGMIVRFVVLILTGCVALIATTLRAVPHNFDLPAQAVSSALLMLAKQAECEVLFSYDELEDLVSQPVSGRYETPVALELLLRNTG
uniref:hypothetical protein n=1 Tax=Cephaloticoccus sp. TaxID=1985742 RepID=UPI0040492711